MQEEGGHFRIAGMAPDLGDLDGMRHEGLDPP
jgi:hypothetical protein